MLTHLVDQAISKPLEIKLQNGVNSVAFSPDGSYLVTGCNGGEILQWRVCDGEKMGMTMKADDSVSAIAISSDGKWIVSGGLDKKVTVWDAKTQKRAVESTQDTWVNALDVSPGSTRFASASSDNAVNISSLSTGQRLVGPLRHGNRVACIAFSPDGDHIATAGACDCLRIWDSRDGNLILEILDFFPESLVWWCDERIFAASVSAQRWIEVLSGVTLLELPCPGNMATKVVVSRKRNVLVSLEKYRLRLWDHNTYTWSPTTHELGYAGCDIAITHDGRQLVTGGEDGISIWNFLHNIPEEVSHYRDCMFMHLTNTILELWLDGRMTSAIDVLSRDIALNRKSHYTLANRALIRTRLLKWDDALIDAEMAIDVQPSIIGYIAKSVALCGKGKREDSMQAFDLCFTCCRAEHLSSLLLIKSVILFLGGFYSHAIGRMGDLIKSSPNTSFRIVQAYMSILLAESAIHSRDYDDALRLLASATDPEEFSESPELLTISLITGWNFKTLTFEMRRKKCEALLTAGLTERAAATFLEMELEVEIKLKEEIEWATDYRRRCVEELVRLGDIAKDSGAHGNAATYFSSVLSLDSSSIDAWNKRSRAYTATSNWELALRDADEAIVMNPFYPWSYEAKHAALHGAARYEEAIESLNEMHLKVGQSPDPRIRELRHRYASPLQLMAVVSGFAKQAQRGFPLVLIDTEKGHLCTEQERLRVFETHPMFKQLVSSLILQIDNAAINRLVQEFFRYATFSHTWDEEEPLFHDLQDEPAYILTESPKMKKLLMFCATAREAGFRWAWSDTCCINKSDGVALQESLTSMFQWYHTSSLTVVHLKGVFSDPELRTLEKSLWNTRAWTLQEFFASKTIRFYTEDWKPYITDGVFNHKDCPNIMREMALATGVDGKELLSLLPGSENVRQKLRLASTRFATKQEDIAYSLFGIFDVSIPITYGEGQQRALGRLLQEVLTRSGDATILDWTGKASDYNSCLPAEIVVYREPLSQHLPLPISDEEMEKVVSELETTPTLHDSAIELYDRLVFLPTPRLVSRRLSLACIVFLLRTVRKPLLAEDDPSIRIYHTTASAFGDVEIRTSDDLTSLSNLVLIHPWLQSLFDPVLPHEDMLADDDDKSLFRIIPDTDPPADGNRPRLSLQHVTHALQLPSPLDKTTRALRLLARLKKPFGALLLAPLSPREYKRVATDHPIVVRIHREVSPQYLLDRIRILDIL